MGEFNVRFLFEKGALYQRTYLTKKAKEILLELIEETLSKTCDIEYEFAFDVTMQSMTYLQDKINGNKSTIDLNVDIARYLHYWIYDYRFNWHADEPDFDRAMQYVSNLFNRKYAISDFCK